jgi:hypothetical protein
MERGAGSRGIADFALRIHRAWNSEHGTESRKTDIRGQKSEIGDRKSALAFGNFDVLIIPRRTRDQKSAVRGQRESKNIAAFLPLPGTCTF